VRDEVARKAMMNLEMTDRVMDAKDATFIQGASTLLISPPKVG